MLSYHPDHFTTARWHLVLCKPNRHQIAFRHLDRRGFDLFMPRHRTARRWRGRVRQELRPVFGGYLFVAVDAARPRWHEIASAPGVARLVGCGASGPAAVPGQIVAGLMARCDPDGLLSHPDDFAAGDRIRIASGPFADFVASVERIDEDRRLHVLLDVLGRPTRVQVDPALALHKA